MASIHAQTSMSVTTLPVTKMLTAQTPQLGATPAHARLDTQEMDSRAQTSMSVTTLPVTAMLIAQTPQMEVTRVHARRATQEMVTLLAQTSMSVTTVPVTAMLTAQTLPPEVTHAHARLVLLGMDFHAKILTNVLQLHAILMLIAQTALAVTHALARRATQEMVTLTAQILTSV